MSQDKSGKITSISIVFLIIGIVVGVIVGYGASAGQIGPLQDQVTSLQSQITSLQGQLTTLENNNTALRNEIAVLSLLSSFTFPAFINHINVTQNDNTTIDLINRGSAKINVGEKAPVSITFYYPGGPEAKGVHLYIMFGSTKGYDYYVEAGNYKTVEWIWGPKNFAGVYVETIELWSWDGIDRRTATLLDSQEITLFVDKKEISSWSLLKSFDGSGDLSSDYFSVTGMELKITWSYTSTAPGYGVFSYNLFKGSHSVIMNSWAPSSGTDYVHEVEIGTNYYLKVIAANCQWNVEIYVGT